MQIMKLQVSSYGNLSTVRCVCYFTADLAVSTTPNGKPDLKFNKKVLGPVPIHHPATPNARFALVRV